MSKKDLAKVNLTLLKKLVSELEASTQRADGINRDNDLNEYITEMSRASGLAAGVAHEATALVHDIYALIRTSQSFTKEFGMDLLDQLLDPKGTGNAN